jgi:DNA-binding LacI/PurR family transcriptional regulator
MKKKVLEPSIRMQMADIARLSGVSVATVSRALNGSSLVNAETRERVTDLARSLNYSINIGAKNLRLKQNKTVAVVIPYDTGARQHLSDPFFLSMLGSLADTLTERGYDMLVSRVDADRLDLVAALFDSGRAAGIILIGQWRHHDQLNDLARRRVPMAVWGAKLPQQFYCTVGSDNVEGGRLATQHLLAQGRRHIVFLGDRNLPEVAQRLQGYTEALQAAQLIQYDDLVIPTDFTAGGGERAVADLLAKGTRFDAIFAASDLLAMTAINMLRRQSIHVPHDVAVVGYDDIELASHVHPPLTTVRQPIGIAGRTLVDIFIKIVEGEDPDSVLLPTQLVIRGTTTLI